MKILGDDDMGKGGIDVLNTETGESKTVRERERATRTHTVFIKAHSVFVMS